MASNDFLVRKLLELDDQVKALTRGGIGLGHSSIASGETLDFVGDSEIQLTEDGINYVQGPPPPKPTAPTLVLGFGTIAVSWDGRFSDLESLDLDEDEEEETLETLAPLSFDRVEVHCSTDPEEEEWGSDTLRGSISSAAGGTSTVFGGDVDDEVFVCLIARNKTGVYGEPSETSSVIITGFDFAALTNELDAATTTISNAGEILVSETTTLDEKLTEAFDAINAIEVGGRKIHFEERPPTVEDPGTLGDTWFVGTVVDGVISNTTGQFYYGESGWTEMKLSHEVIGSVDIGTLVAGSAVIKQAVIDRIWAEVVVAQMVIADEFIGENAILTGAITAPKITASEELWAKIGEFVKIRTEQLEANAIDGLVITGSTLQSPDGGFMAGDPGLFISGPDGTSIIRFPTDGSPLSMSAADVEIERANIEDLEMLRASVRSGGKITLESGVRAPVSPPIGTSSWNEISNFSGADWSGDVNSTRTGLSRWKTGGVDKWVRSLNIHGDVENDRIQILNLDGSIYAEHVIDFNPRYGLTVLGDICYIFGAAHVGGQPMIRGYDLTSGARVKSWNYDRSFYSKPTLGNDGTNLVVAGIYNYKLWVHKRSTSTGNQVGSDWIGDDSWPSGVSADLFGVYINGSELTVVPTVTSRVYTMSGSTLVRKSDSANSHGWAGWNTPGSSPVAVYWEGASVPTVATITGEVYAGSQRASRYDVTACVTWYDGLHETTPSPSSIISCGARSFPTLSLLVRAGLQKRVYWKVNTGQWRRETLSATVSSVRLDPDTTGIAVSLPTVNTFPNAAPAILTSTNGNIEFSGDGSGKLGPLTFHADGSMTSSQIPAWVPITSFLNGWGVSADWFVPAYRVWADGKVEWRGTLTKTGTPPSAGQVVFNVPAAAMPGGNVGFAVRTASSSGASVIGGFDFRKTTSDAAVFPVGGTAPRVSLDGIFYYKT